MKKLIALATVTALVVLPQLGFAADQRRALEADPEQKECPEKLTRDRFIPWPWGKEIAIPWSEIQGTWRIDSEDRKSYFSFKVLNSEHEEFRQLQVTELAARSCEQVSIGLGYEAENVVKAVLRKPETVQRQVFALRGFNTADVPCLVLPGAQEKVMVVSLSSPGAIASDHYMISKISPQQNDCPIEE